MQTQQKRAVLHFALGRGQDDALSVQSQSQLTAQGNDFKQIKFAHNPNFNIKVLTRLLDRYEEIAVGRNLMASYREE